MSQPGCGRRSGGHSGRVGLEVCASCGDGVLALGGWGCWGLDVSVSLKLTCEAMPEGSQGAPGLEPEPEPRVGHLVRG